VHKRSEKGKHHQIEKKRKRIRIQTLSIPHTKTDRERFKPPDKEMYVNFPFICRGLQHGVLIHHFKDLIPTELVTTLESSTESLNNLFPPPSNQTSRGNQNCYYFGHWRDSSSSIHKCPHSNSLSFQTWFEKNKNLFEFLSDHLKKNYPFLFEEYEKLDKQYRMFGIWSLAVLNIDSPSTFHIDAKDWQNGFCAVITFGKYSGGELHFPAINTTVNIQKKRSDFISKS